MFLDRELCIRKFTPRIAEIFQVIPHDVGRPLASFMHSLGPPVADGRHRAGPARSAGLRNADVGQTRTLLLPANPPYRGRSSQRPDHPQAAATAQAGPDGVVLTLTDISALEQARARLAQLSAIVESSDDAIVSTTRDGIVTSWNNGATRLYGYTADEAIGRHASFLSPAGRKEEVDVILAGVRDGQAVERLETTRLRKDGSSVDVSVTFSPILDASLAVVGISAIFHDITQLVRARDEIAEREGGSASSSIRPRRPSTASIWAATAPSATPPVHGCSATTHRRR